MTADDINRSQQYNTANGDAKQQQGAAECLFDFFVRQRTQTRHKFWPSRF